MVVFFCFLIIIDLALVISSHFFLSIFVVLGQFFLETREGQDSILVPILKLSVALLILRRFEDTLYVCFSCRLADYARRIKGQNGAHLVGDLSKFEQHLLETQEVMTVRGKVSLGILF